MEHPTTDLIILPTRNEVRLVSGLVDQQWQHLPAIQVRRELEQLAPVPRSVLVSEGIGGRVLVPLFPFVHPEQAESVLALDPLIHLVDLTKEA